jgi:dTDP-4-amino-4,6-dideoxygalactose transaminase
MSVSFTKTLELLLEKSNIVKAGRGALGIYASLVVWGGDSAVAVPASICQDVVAAILLAGRKPIFCDVNPETGLTPESEWIRVRMAGAKIAIVVHLYGNPSEINFVEKLFAHGLVIDDGAQALGAINGTGWVGTQGDVGVISFGTSKQIEVGGAVLVFKDHLFAKECEKYLRSILITDSSEMLKIQQEFRVAFDLARKKLISGFGNSDFNGLLRDYLPVIKVGWKKEWEYHIVSKLGSLKEQISIRKNKAKIWENVTKKIGFQPVGMGDNSSPWRYTCRLPDCNWKNQDYICKELRKEKINVSNWYLPANYYFGETQNFLSGAEQLAQEVFQFWIDCKTNVGDINHGVQVLESLFGNRKLSDCYKSKG